MSQKQVARLFGEKHNTCIVVCDRCTGCVCDRCMYSHTSQLHTHTHTGINTWTSHSHSHTHTHTHTFKYTHTRTVLPHTHTYKYTQTSHLTFTHIHTYIHTQTSHLTFTHIHKQSHLKFRLCAIKRKTLSVWMTTHTEPTQLLLLSATQGKYCFLLHFCIPFLLFLPYFPKILTRNVWWSSVRMLKCVYACLCAYIHVYCLTLWSQGMINEMRGIHQQGCWDAYMYVYLHIYMSTG